MQFDIVKLGNGSKPDTFRYAKSLTGNDAQELVKEVQGRAEKDFDNAKVLQGYFGYDPGSGLIQGSSTFLGILANSILAKQNRWLPTVQDGVALDNSGRLSNGVCRDWGVVVYSEGNPNSEIAKVLLEKGYNLPILASFKDLRLRKAVNNYGLEIVFADEPKELITGVEASKFLEENKFIINKFGACRVVRDVVADYLAYWSRVAGSDREGRMDFVCAEGTCKSLEE